MGSKNLVIAAALLLALSGAVWWAKKHPNSGTSSTNTPSTTTNLVNVPGASVTQIDLTRKGSPTIQVSHDGGKWQITAPQTFPVDQSTIDGITGALSPATAENVVDAKPSNVAQFGLNAPSLTVAVHEKGGKVDKLSFGDDIPAGSSVYASVGSDPKVYAVASSVKSSLDKTVNDLRDKRLLTFDTNKLTQLELDNAKGQLQFAKNNGGDWQIIKPSAMRADSTTVDDLIRKLGDAKMDLNASPDDQKKAVTAFASNPTVSAAKVTDASGTQTLTVKKAKDDYYAKSSITPGDYKLSADLGKDLEKSADDFRNKKVYDFGWSDPTKLQLDGSTGAQTFVHSGTDWKKDGKTMDPGTVQSLIDKLRELTATKFPATGFTAPIETATVTSNDGKRTERVEFAKTSTGYIARRANEPALYELDAKAVDDMLGAAKAIKPAAGTKK